jgi:integrase
VFIESTLLNAKIDRMATFKICVFEHHRRSDGKYPVSIRVCWRRGTNYIPTEYYVTDKQISRKTLVLENGKQKKVLEVRDAFILKQLSRRTVFFENLKSQKLGESIYHLTSSDLANYFQREWEMENGGGKTIDFVAFARLHCDKLRNEGRAKTARTLMTPVNALIDFCGREKINIDEINGLFLRDFEAFLRTKRTIRRQNQLGGITTIEKEGCSDTGIRDYMTSIRVLFNAARFEFNDEDINLIRIKHYPFSKYKIIQLKEARKKTLSAEEIRSIMNLPDSKLDNPRPILARDVFLLSFCLAGTNIADIYYMTRDAVKAGRISYERKKTRSRRKDSAFISMAIPKEIGPLIDQYRARKEESEYLFRFAEDYSNHEVFCSSINEGLKVVAETCGIKVPLTSYYARFSFATIARNDCGISKDDISMALNHRSIGSAVTDGYIKKDWGIVDRTIRMVLDKLK